MYSVPIGESYGTQGFNTGQVALDARRHSAIFGVTGAGKSVLLRRMMLYPALEGRGIFAVDPHASLIEAFLNDLPKYRTEDVIYFNPTSENPIGLNPLRDRTQLAVDQAIEIFSELYGENSWGGRSAIVARNFGYALIEAEDKPTLIHLRTMFFDKNYRQWIFQRSTSQAVKQFSKKFEEEWNDRLREEASAAPANKVDALTACDQLRHIFGQYEGLDFARAIKDRRIILWALNKGAIGEENAALLGSVGLRMVLNAGLARGYGAELFHIFYDEFHTFTKGSAYKEVFSETRKYGYSFTLADQNLSQLPEGAEQSIFANVGNLIVFRTSAEDAKKFVPELDLEHHGTLTRLPDRELYVRRVENGVVKVSRCVALPPIQRDYAKTPKDAIKRTSEVRYGVERTRVEKSLQEIGGRNERKPGSFRGKTKATRVPRRKGESRPETFG